VNQEPALFVEDGGFDGIHRTDDYLIGLGIGETLGKAEE
jgi:hypothetical protein